MLEREEVICLASAKGKNWKEELLLEKRRRRLKSVGWKMEVLHGTPQGEILRSACCGAHDETWEQAAPRWADRDGSAGVCAWGLGVALGLESGGWDLGLEPGAWS